jgi:hypothetical protein
VKQEHRTRRHEAAGERPLSVARLSPPQPPQPPSALSVSLLAGSCLSPPQPPQPPQPLPQLYHCPSSNLPKRVTWPRTLGIVPETSANCMDYGGESVYLVGIGEGE